MLLFSAVALFVLAFAASIEVRQCPDTSEGIVKSNVELHPCRRVPCHLKKGTTQSISIEFTPGTDIKEITNKVWANVLGADVPFVGVDGQSICNKIFNESGKKVSCPLKAGIKYVYKDSFPVYSFYPSLSVNVHWALKSDHQEIVCFEVPAKIK